MAKCIGIDNEDLVFQVETSIQVMCSVFLIQWSAQQVFICQNDLYVLVPSDV